MLRLLPTVVGLAAVVSADATPPSNDAPLPVVARPAESQRSDATSIEVARLRLREGTRLNDKLGHFQLSGDALTFVDEDGREIGGLPNLNLERVLRMLKSIEDPASVKWSVSGVVTEFSGRNFLLINRAIYKAAMPPAPETVGAADDAPAAESANAAPPPAAPDTVGQP